jgi:hypothetical protein
MCIYLVSGYHPYARIGMEKLVDATTPFEAVQKEAGEERVQGCNHKGSYYVCYTAKSRYYVSQQDIKKHE